MCVDFILFVFEAFASAVYFCCINSLFSLVKRAFVWLYYFYLFRLTVRTQLASYRQYSKLDIIFIFINKKSAQILIKCCCVVRGSEVSYVTMTTMAITTLISNWIKSVFYFRKITDAQMELITLQVLCKSESWNQSFKVSLFVCYNTKLHISFSVSRRGYTKNNINFLFSLNFRAYLWVLQAK